MKVVARIGKPAAQDLQIVIAIQAVAIHRNGVYAVLHKPERPQPYELVLVPVGMRVCFVETLPEAVRYCATLPQLGHDAQLGDPLSLTPYEYSAIGAALDRLAKQC